MEGNISLLNNNIISIIGSRKCTENGKALSYKFSYELSQYGITIASGLAVGIDTFAHLGSFNQKGKTIAVLGCGFNHIFPKENMNLYKKILDNDGLIVSEYPPDTKHQPKYFLERNRIVSGLSLGILVVEAQYRSGTSVTASLANLQGRKVFSIPHEIWNSNGVGTNKLIKNGAIAVTDTDDILLEFENLKCLINKSANIDKVKLNTFCIESKNLNSLFNNLDVNFSKDLSNFYFIPDFTDSSNYIGFSELSNASYKNDNIFFEDQHILKKKLCDNSNFQSVYDLISTTPISINEICKKTSKSIADVSSILFSLELEGYTGSTCFQIQRRK